MTRRERIIYIAALLEGEGCFTVHHAKSGAVSVSVNIRMTDEDIVEHFRELCFSIILRQMNMEIRKVEPRLGAKIKSRKTIFGFTVSNDNAVFIMKEVLPFMGVRRSARIKECIQAWESRVTISEASIRSRARQKRCLRTEDLFR